MDDDWDVPSNVQSGGAGVDTLGGTTFGRGRGRGVGGLTGNMDALSVGGSGDGWGGSAKADNGWESSGKASNGWESSGNASNGWEASSKADDGWGTSSKTDNGWGSAGKTNDGWGASNGMTFGDAPRGGGGGGRGGGFRSGGRGGGAGGGGRGCFKCGEEGHMSRECPSGGGGGFGGGGGSRACFKCGEDGHISRDCPSGGGGGGGGGSRACYKCGEEGHISRDCPTGGSGGGGFGGGGGSRACYKCGEEGHMSRECPSGGGGGGSRACYKCGEEGHMSRECPTGGGGGRGFGGDSGGGGSRACYKCGEEGHMSRECPTGGDRRPRGCFNCGEEGHQSKDCPNPAKTRVTTGEDGKPREIYVPTETSEDTLYSAGISSGINFAKYQHIPCRVTGNDICDPIATFDESGLRPILLENVRRSGYSTPTPVQRYAIPIVKRGRDLMACAQTGSGKTAAFLLPVIHTLLEQNVAAATFSPCQEPFCVVVSPTRELAMQIYNEARKFSNTSVIRAVVAYGGTSVQHQSNMLQKGCHILVATPGRLLDFVEKGKVSFAQCKFFVLDEADRMLDMGFQGDIDRMINHPTMPSKGERQTLMFSATFPDAIQRLAASYLNDYLFLMVGVVGAASTDVTQTFLEVSHREKRDKLESVLRDIGNAKTLVFVEAKRVADFIASHLCQAGFPTTSIHGDRLQREREEALADFKYGKTPTLIATSVASRGLDIKGVANVVNYDLPKTIDDYVHRIGRTGRVGNTGSAVSFYDGERDSALAADLVKILAGAEQEVPDFLQRDAGSSEFGGGGGSSFASRDIRRGFGSRDGGGPAGYNQQPAPPSTLEAEESWD